MDILIDIIIEIICRGWFSRLGANIRFFILRIFKNEEEIIEKIYTPEEVFGDFTQGVYNFMVGFSFAAIIIIGIIGGFFYYE